jgi:hypothetical protein
MYLKSACFAAMATTIALVACTNPTDHPPAGSGNVPTSGLGAGGGTSDEGGASLTDGGLDGEAGSAAACNGVTQQGTSVAELMIDGDPPPPLGGTIAPGTYVLTELDSYGPLQSNDAGTQGGLTGVVGRATLVVTANTLTVLGARGTSAAPLPADTVTASSFAIADTSLQTKTLCPTAGTAATVPFSSVGGGLALFVGTKRRELYTRQ